MSYLLGIDVGTSGIKSSLIDETGKVVASAYAGYMSSHPKPNWSEQNPDQWWKSLIQTIKEIAAYNINLSEIKGIGLAGQMHSLVLLDKNNTVLRPAILWNDQRTVKECAYVTEIIGQKKLMEIACNPALTGFTVGKIIWVRDNEPKTYEKINKILLAKDYLRFKLTGEFATEVSDASGTLLLDVPNRNWSKEILKKLDIPEKWLPECYESTEISGKISKEAAGLTGLKENIPVVGGAGDQAAQAIGAGIIEPGLVSVTLGTSGVVLAYSDKAILDPKGRLHTFCYVIPDKWHVMGVTLAAGGSLRWLRDTLCQEEIAMARLRNTDIYNFMAERADKIPVGCEGLIYLPYLNGERTPHTDPNAKGVFFGLNPRHSKTYLVRAVFEGVAYGIRDSFEIIKELKIPIKQVRISGGGARSPFWRQMIADMNDIELVTLNNIGEGAAYGAALLAGVGTNIYKSVQEACNQTLRVTAENKPIKENMKQYEKYYQLFTALYPALKPNFAKLAKILE